ncbi:MAG TPA: glycosyltransferase [bacterium]|jgi:glycosyltransferase involved in cell wall biosynthesis|nr:glycosyltransferase [bacterium]HOG37865.1 glycosyltransferase [bacterium]HQI03082.1 glycosyltransferase [bacterium]
MRKTQKQEQKFDIVMFSMSSYSEWDSGTSNRNFQVLKQLKNNPKIDKILTVDYLPHTIKRAIKNYKVNILGNTKGNIIKKSRLTKIYQPEEKITVYSTISNIFSTKKTLQNINKFLKKHGYKNVILWSYYPLNADYFDEVEHSVSVFDTVDNWCEHSSYLKFKKKLEKNYKTIKEKANIIFVLSKSGEEIFTPRKDNIYHITQGVDLAHYMMKNKLINNDIAKIHRPIIGYIGIIQENRINFDLIEYIAKKNLDKSIVLIGPIWNKDHEKLLKNYSNIYLLGKKTYGEAPDYINQFDVGIIPHMLNDFIKYTCPMKVYEYLACGIPVVTTDAPGIEQFKDVVSVANDFEKFNIAIQEELNNDSQEKIDNRIKIIKDHTWEKKVDQMLNHIQTLI